MQYVRKIWRGVVIGVCAPLSMGLATCQVVGDVQYTCDPDKPPAPITLTDLGEPTKAPGSGHYQCAYEEDTAGLRCKFHVSGSGLREVACSGQWSLRDSDKPMGPANVCVVDFDERAGQSCVCRPITAV